MKKLIFLLAILLANCTPNKKLTTVLPLKEGITQAQVNLIATTVHQFPINTVVAVGIVQGENTVFYGVEKQENQLIMMDNQDAVFEIGSISKVFTTHLMVNALNKQKIKSIEQPIQEHLKFPLAGNATISFKQLANHTSGLPYFPPNLDATIFERKNPLGKYSAADLESYLTTDLKLEQASGKKHVYSNTGMGLLGYLVTKIEEDSYENLLQTQIFEPLQMQSSTTDRTKITNKLVQARNKKGKPTENWDFDVLAGAGAILSTTNDLSKYAQWTFKGLQTTHKPMQTKTFTISDKSDVALGWHIIKNKTKVPFIWHNGATGGYKSSMGIHIATQKSVIVLSNVSGKHAKKRAIDNLCFDLLKTME